MMETKKIPIKIAPLMRYIISNTVKMLKVFMSEDHEATQPETHPPAKIPSHMVGFCMTWLLQYPGKSSK